MDLKATLNLPNPDFTIPMKADLAIREPQMLSQWEQSRIYHRLMEARKDAPTYVLHDGPPYTNGPIHLGTAMNKVLKDFVLKSRGMMGFRTPFVPGYDNHGLPIELAALKKFQEQKVSPDKPTLRQACRDHAEQYVALQTDQFKRLGIFGLWEQPYLTMDFRFEAEIIRVFKRLVEAKQVYRGLRPVMWSPTSRTALADTEIVYQEFVSKSIYVSFPLLDDHNGWSKGMKNVSCVIWTTTPWTIPANLAVAFHPGMEYVVVKAEDQRHLLQKGLHEKVMAAVGISEFSVEATFLGATFEFSKFQHPIFNRESVAVLADHVNTEDGTGVVHTAPGHGREDFVTGVKYGLGVLCPVDERGTMTEEAGEFAGLSYRDCDQAVVNRLQELGRLLLVEDCAHTYPHSERDGKPVIFRATEQWFISMEDNDLRATMLSQVDKVRWVPDSGYGRIRGMIGARPDWCISRQRPWGVGIPVFYGAKSGIPVLDPVAIEAVARLVESEGSDAWYKKDPTEILPAGYTFADETEFTKEVDVFDVWFDSGSTSLATLEGNVNPEWKENWPADLFLEGSDQHRGWFNVSLILGTATRGQAPYKAVVTHGFVTDEQGQKMSKRLGNIVDPVEVCDKMGADVFRYWCASVNYQDDMPCGENILKTCGEGYRTLRNTFRFLLGNLYDFEPSQKPATLEDLDEWIIEQAELLTVDIIAAYEDFEFRKALVAINDFCVKELSSFYLDAIKDRMYCDGADWPSRRSGQWACHQALSHLLRAAAPILPFTCEETYQRLPGRAHDSVFFEVFKRPSEQRLKTIQESALHLRIGRMLEIRANVFALFEVWKKSNDAKNGQAVVLDFSESFETIEFLRSFDPNELAHLFKFSWINLEVGDPDAKFWPSTFRQCDRSKVFRPDVEEVNGHWLTARDRRAVGW